MTLTITVRLRGLPAGHATGAPAADRAAAARRGSDRSGGRQPGDSTPGDSTPGGSLAGGSLARATGPLGTLLPLAEPAALLLAEAAGLGLLGRVLLTTAFRSAERVLAE